MAEWPLARRGPDGPGLDVQVIMAWPPKFQSLQRALRARVMCSESL